MFDRPAQTNRNQTQESDPSYFVSPPSLSLPKGGGAIKGMGEKFAANPVTGTGSMSIPITTSPGRSGFGPQLSLSYDSGAGNGIFGLGWNLSLPSITRKTDKGLPRYWDGEESDVFILSGAEDLVPVLKADGTVDEFVRDGYRIQRYRPRVEGLFARIERWTNQSDPQETFWRSLSKDNITTVYGKTAESRIADPNHPISVFSWLICESYDDSGQILRTNNTPFGEPGFTLRAFDAITASNIVPLGNPIPLPANGSYRLPYTWQSTGGRNGPNLLVQVFNPQGMMVGQVGRQFAAAQETLNITVQ